MVWPRTKDGDDDSPAAGPSPASEPEPSSNEPSSQDSTLSTTISTSTYPPFPQQAPVLLAYNSSNDTASSPPPANSYEDYYYSIPSAQPRTHHYYPRITHSISATATESSTQLPSPPDSNFILCPTPPEQGQQQAPGGKLPQRGGQLFDDSFDHARLASSRQNPPARQYPGLSASKNDAETFIDDDEDDAALNSILDGVGKMHITMGRDNSGRWRIRRTGDTLD
ncbi:unnamed protein product [Clonostachys chloroleuca]|uniref:Uncharacterized protein n=1 Tax=Clonostachys chloroleuca TaxID=1926264 RepID=A0AA35MBL3_9HYPO|nr:unnamed protein product [Clonostachys chloroleuca]